MALPLLRDLAHFPPMREPISNEHAEEKASTHSPPEEAFTLGHLLDASYGALVEWSDGIASAATSLATTCIAQAQERGEFVAWIAGRSSAIDLRVHPPDMRLAGIDFHRLLFVNIPATKSPAQTRLRLMHAAELLARTASVGTICIDFLSFEHGLHSNTQVLDVQKRASPVTVSKTLQTSVSRLAKIAEEHALRVLILSPLLPEQESLSPLVSLRLRSEWRDLQSQHPRVALCIEKDKRHLLSSFAHREWLLPAHRLLGGF